LSPRLLYIQDRKIYLREMGWDGMDWIDQAEDMDQGKALVNTVINLPVP
jgi:hypothetical protein